MKNYWGLFITFAFVLGGCATSGGTKPVSQDADLAKNTPSRASRAIASSDPNHHHRPKYNFPISEMAGNYKLIAESGEGDCFYWDGVARPTTDSKMTLQYQLNIIKRDFWTRTSYFPEITLITENRYMNSYFSDIDQGKLEYTRHDVENPTVLDYLGCMALYGHWGAMRYASAYCKANQNRKQPVPDYNPSTTYRLETYTTPDRVLTYANVEIRRPQEDVTLTKERLKQIHWIDADHLKIVQQEKSFDDERARTVKECTFERMK